MDTMATEPPGHGGRSVHSIALFTAFAFLAGRACALASDAATTVRTQRTTTHCTTSQNDCLWALVPICPGSRFAGCGAIDCMRWRKPLLDLNAPVERIHLPIFIPLSRERTLFARGDRSSFLFFLLSLRPDRGQRGLLSFAACLLVSRCVSRGWVEPKRRGRPRKHAEPITTASKRPRVRLHKGVLCLATG
jgi:hypothetical protein